MIYTRVTQIFLALIGLAFCKTGVESLIDPHAVLAQVGIELNNPSAVSSMRAVYGGMHLIFGLFCFRGILNAFGGPLLLIVLYTTGFIIGRLVGIMFDGTPNTFVLTWLITEVISGAIALALWIRTQPASAITHIGKMHKQQL